MTTNSYPISCILYDTDGSTPISGATVTAFNTNNEVQLPKNAQVTTNALGEYILDLANFLIEYNNSDVIIITAYNNTKSIDHRHTVDTDIGFLSKNLNIHHRAPIFDSGYIQSLTFISDAATESVVLYDRKDGRTLIRLRAVLANSTVTAYFGDGIKTDKGPAIIYDDDSGGSPIPNEAFVTMRQKQQ